jgi:hypothetical protein
MPTTMKRRAARAVALHAPGTPAERRQLLDMLGLLDEAGGIDERQPTVETYVATLGAGNGDSSTARGRFAAHLSEGPDHPETFTSPPALRNLPPLPEPEPAPRPPRAKKASTGVKGRPRRAVADGVLRPPTHHPETCGQLKGRRVHARAGEDLCDACRQVFNDWQKERRRVPPEQRKRAQRAPCGTPHGVKAHEVRGEEVCADCREAKRAQSRSYWHALPREKRQSITSARVKRRAAVREAARAAENQQQAS